MGRERGHALDVPRLHGHRSHRHGVRGGLPALDAAARRVRARPHRVRGPPRPRRARSRVGGVAPDARAHPRARLLPEHAVQAHRPGRDADCRRHQSRPRMNPTVDFHALAPEIVLTAAILVVLVVDLIWPERSRWTSSRIASIGVLAALIPVITLAADGSTRSLFDGAFVVDNYALAMQGFFLVVAYV